MEEGRAIENGFVRQLPLFHPLSLSFSRLLIYRIASRPFACQACLLRATPRAAATRTG